MGVQRRVKKRNPELQENQQKYLKNTKHCVNLNMRATHNQQKQILDLCSTCAWSTGRTLPSQSPRIATLQAIPWMIGNKISFKKV